MKIIAALIVLVAMALSGCAGKMLDGRIVKKSDGQTLPMKIQTSYGRGMMTATNPATGESFSGTYTAIRDVNVDSYFSGSSNTDFTVNTNRGNYANGNTQSIAFASATSQSRTANAKAFLVGDRGTTLDIVMKIQAGFPPVGFGEARDNRGQRYHVEF